LTLLEVALVGHQARFAPLFYLRGEDPFGAALFAVERVGLKDDQELVLGAPAFGLLSVSGVAAPPPRTSSLHFARVTYETPLFSASLMIGTLSGGIIFRTTDSLNSGLYLFIFIAPPSVVDSHFFNTSVQATSIMTQRARRYSLTGHSLTASIILLRRFPLAEQHPLLCYPFKLFFLNSFSSFPIFLLVVLLMQSVNKHGTAAVYPDFAAFGTGGFLCFS
jgi:hypothetical protein